MIKIRLTFSNDEKGLIKFAEALDNIKRTFNVLSVSKVYKGRGESKFSNVYIDVENKSNILGGY